MSILNRDIIDARIQKIRISANKLKRYVNMSYDEFVEDSDNIDIAERNLELAIEAMLDIGNHIIASLCFEKPNDYFDIVITLGRHKVIPNDFAQKVAPLAGLRNRLVHDYLGINYKTLHKNIKESLLDFETFSKEILSFVEKTK
ncbi:MAG: DUF86 domain-containing protein [Pseudomonadota bacterium]